MAVGDWPSGAYISLDGTRGYLNALAQGAAHVADVDYFVVLPSGARVFNGGVAGFVPFHYVADASLSIQSQGMALIAALAASQGLDVHLTTGVVHPDGSFTPA
jgi:hypothetical protein